MKLGAKLARAGLVKSASLPYIEPEKAFSICLARRDMNFVRTYLRVLKELGSESRIAIILVLANLALAAAQFAEPILFGRIIDKLAEAQKSDVPLQWEALAPLIAAWVGFGLFTIAAAVLVALHSDRLSHRRRLAVMGAYFEHVLHLPLSFHTASHSGRLRRARPRGPHHHRGPRDPAADQGTGTGGLIL